MKYTVAITFVALLAGFAVAASAQQQPAVNSFEQLRTRLRAGDKLIVRDAEGKTTRGRLSAIAGDRIEIKSWRWRSFRVRPRVFTETAVRRIEFEDRTWNGALIGLGVAGAAIGIGCMADHGGYGCLYLLVLAPPFGVSVGTAVDSLINRTIYQAPGGHASITLSPLLGARRIGLSARAWF
jgi:hypothetical protein